MRLQLMVTFWCATALAGSAQAAPIITARAAPIYRMDGTLYSTAFVFNFRNADGSPAMLANHQWVVNAPWGQVGWSGSAPDGFVFFAGPGYRPGTYYLRGTVDGQTVRAPITVPTGWRNSESLKEQVSAGKSASGRYIYLHITLPEAMKTNMMTGFLAPDQKPGQELYYRGPGPMPGFDEQATRIGAKRWSMSMTVWNVANLYAPSGRENQALEGRRVLSHWIYLDTLPLNGWVNVSPKDKK